MAFDLLVLSGPLLQKQAAQEILSLNELTENYALSLTMQQAAELVETRSSSLKNTGRIEFGGGVLDKIIKKFCDSPFISSHNYAETLHELTEAFYYFKNETLDLISDGDLIGFMKEHFNGSCHGSLDLLNRDLEKMARVLRCGYDTESEQDIDESGDDDCEQY